ncbi:hypothetical protein ACWF2L_06990 [Streptomyces anulatus]
MVFRQPDVLPATRASRPPRTPTAGTPRLLLAYGLYQTQWGGGSRSAACFKRLSTAHSRAALCRSTPASA